MANCPYRIRIGDPFDRKTAERVCRRVRHLLNTPLDNRPLVFSINSNGGVVLSAVYLVSLIRRLQKKRETTAFAKQAGSSAAVVFLACQRRVLRKGGYIFLHPIQLPKEPTVYEAKKNLPRLLRCQKKIEKMILQRTYLSKREVKRIMSSANGRYFSAEEALEFGLCDEVI